MHKGPWGSPKLPPDTPHLPRSRQTCRRVLQRALPRHTDVTRRHAKWVTRADARPFGAPCTC